MQCFVAYLKKENQSNPDHSLNSDDSWSGGIVDFDGTIKEATVYYTKMLLHHGDPYGTYEEYGAYELTDDDAIQVLVYPLTAAIVGCIGEARWRHNRGGR